MLRQTIDGMVMRICFKCFAKQELVHENRRTR